MTVNFIYPNSTPKPAETFTVTFVADGVTVKEITKNVGETVATSEFPAVPAKEGYTGAWDVTTNITATTTVTAKYTAISTGDAKLTAIFTDGVYDFASEFDPDTKVYNNVQAEPGYAKYVIAGYAEDDVTITYSIDGSAFGPANVDDAFYFDLTRGNMSSVKIKLTDKDGAETIYTFNVVIPAASNEAPAIETSGFEIKNFNSATRTYTVTADETEKYVRLWGKAVAEDGDDGRTFEYAVGSATDAPESLTYEALAVNCGERENTYFAGTDNFDVNWNQKGFVNLWTEDGLSGKAMFIKVIGDGNPEVGYYTIIFE